MSVDDEPQALARFGAIEQKLAESRIERAGPIGNGEVNAETCHEFTLLPPIFGCLLVMADTERWLGNSLGSHLVYNRRSLRSGQGVNSCTSLRNLAADVSFRSGAARQPETAQGLSTATAGALAAI